MSRLRAGRPLWLARPHAVRHRRYASLDCDLGVDVVVVGGGFVGASVAWMLASHGVSVAVLESSHVGLGSTAASSALLMQEPDTDYQELAALYGARATKRIWELSRDATRELISTLRRNEIECALEGCDSVYYTRNAEVVARLRAEQQRRARGGFSATWLSADALQRTTGIDGAGAIRAHGNACLDPYRACLGLLAAAQRRGAHIFEGSAVRSVTRNGTGVAAVTAGGTVFADYAIIATGYATPEPKTLSARFAMKQTYVFATERIPAKTRKAMGFGDVMVWDTQRPYHYARWTRDHRLIAGGGDRPRVTRGRGAALRREISALRDHFLTLWPALADVRIEHCWEGLFAMTPDGLPYIGPHARYPRQLFALGYGGNGMTFAFIAARLLLEWIRGTRSADHDLFAFNRHRRKGDAS